MRKLTVMCALVGAVAGCETRGVVVSDYSAGHGSHVRLKEFRDSHRFLYALSASYRGSSCKPHELKIVAMGVDGKLSLRVKTAPTTSCS